MAVGVSEVKAVILQKVGAALDGLPDEVMASVRDVVTGNLPTLWELWAAKSLIYPGLQALYVERACLEILQGQSRDLLQVTIGQATINQNQILANLTTLRNQCQKEIERMEEMAQKSRQPAIGTMASRFQQDAAGRLYNPLAPPRPTPWRPV